MEKIKLVIFDMDGLMFETGRLAYRAYLSAAEEYDFEVCQDVYYYLTGKTEADIRRGEAIIASRELPCSCIRRSKRKRSLFQVVITINITVPR